MKFLASVSWSGVSAADFVLTSYSSTFRHLKMFVSNITVSAATAIISARTSSNGGSSYDAGASDYKYTAERTGDTFGETFESDATAAQMLIASHGSGQGAMNFELWLFSRQAANIFVISWHGGKRISGEHFTIDGTGLRNAAADVDAIRIFPDTGTLSGDASIYGIV